jgi:hypothetical protein
MNENLMGNAAAPRNSDFVEKMRKEAEVPALAYRLSAWNQ